MKGTKFSFPKYCYLVAAVGFLNAILNKCTSSFLNEVFKS